MAMENSVALDSPFDPLIGFQFGNSRLTEEKSTHALDAAVKYQEIDADPFY